MVAPTLMLGVSSGGVYPAAGVTCAWDAGPRKAQAATARQARTRTAALIAFIDWSPPGGSRLRPRSRAGECLEQVTWFGRLCDGRVTSAAGIQAAGREIRNVVPEPGRLSTSIDPPIAWVRCLAIARPRPVPPSRRSRDRSTR